MSLWKLRVGAEAYYLAQVASGLDDYYSGQGETAGSWTGNAAQGLGLDADSLVSGDDLQAVLAGLLPGTGLTPNGERLRPNARRVPGFDLTFSVPKSVSVVYALGDPLVQQEVLDAGEAAVAEALAWLEREACHVRRGSNRRDVKHERPEQFGTVRMQGAGFVAAKFRHRTSRAGDPQLHWHLLVANMTKGPDGRWTALDATSLYRSQRAAGVVFQAALRRELTQRLGVGWTPPVNDAAEIAGVPERVVRQFSKRRDEIETELERLGAVGPKAAEQATLATRKAKTLIDADLLVTQWHHEATSIGWGPEQLDALLQGVTVDPTLPAVDDIVDAIGDRLIADDATFTRHDLTQAVASALPTGASTRELEQLTAAALAHPEIVTINTTPPTLGTAGWEQQYTTRRLIACETGIDHLLRTARHAQVGIIDPTHATHASTHASLGVDQLEAVTRLCGQGNAIEVLIGRAGTGKTYTLATVANAYNAAGWRTIGVAPSARAARELASGAGIESFTIPRFHHHTEQQPLDATTLVVIDEAGMCGTIDLHHLLTAAHTAGAKVIMVGDHHQLPEVQAGGGLAHAINVLETDVCELTTNRRQHAQWEIDALDQLRHGNIDHAWNAYLTHDRVTITDDPRLLHHLAVDDWWTAHHAGADALLLAGTRRETRILNRLARDLAQHHGLLTGPTLTIADRHYRTGDRILLTHNALQHTPDGQPVRIDNGTLGTIAHINPTTNTIDVHLATGHHVRLDHTYLAGGHLDHGYAMTIHKSQGTTCDQVFVVGSTSLYREAAYVALSRARNGATLYATRQQATELNERDHTRGIPLPSETDTNDIDLVDIIARSHAKQFAITTDPTAAHIATLAALPLDELHRRHTHARTAETHARTAGLTNPADASAEHTRALHTRQHLHIGRRARALDRNNVGTITAIHDTTGQATLLFISETGTPAQRTLHWHNLHPIDHPAPAPLTPEAHQWLTARTEQLAAITSDWEHHLGTTNVTTGEAALVEQAITTRTATLAHQLHAHMPAWLATWIGPRPTDPAGATRWNDTITHIATYRDRHHITSGQPGLGPQPGQVEERQQWNQAMNTVLTNKTWLTTHQPQPAPTTIRPLTPSEIRDRITELEQLFATAPHDTTHLIDHLTGGNLATDELHNTLLDTTRTLNDRSQWILTNWPHIVEHHQLQQLAAQHDPLAHWPTPLRPNVAAALQQLAAAINPDLPTETRTLTQLHTELAALDPGQHLRTLTEQLVTINDQLHATTTSIAVEADPTLVALLQAEAAALRDQHQQLRADINQERQHLNHHNNQHPDAAKLQAAIVSRTNTLFAEAINHQPEWLIELLNDLDDSGTLTQASAAQVYERVRDATIANDRKWAIDEALHTGPVLDGATNRSATNPRVIQLR